jgi:hypothetical protein
MQLPSLQRKSERIRSGGFPASYSGKAVASACVAGVALGSSYGYLFSGFRVRVIDTLVSLLIDPGWRASLVLFPEGVHAGLPFFVTSFLLNAVLYGGIAFAALLFLRTQINPNSPRTH